jgi:hypothetical protein
MKVEFDNAYYIKLGKGGEWEEDNISNSRARIGWKDVDLDLIHSEDWQKIRQTCQQNAASPSAATTDFRALQSFSQSTNSDIWITFHDSRLWWCRLSGKVVEDGISKYRKVDEWRATDVNGEPLLINKVSGRLAQLQAFRGTICKVHAIDDLRHLINATHSAAYREALEAKVTLAERLEKAITALHWKDFELLVDLIFRASGWRRISKLGESMKNVDLELEDPITGDLYQVQVKSKASKQTFDDYAERYSDEFRKFYFVVHSFEDDSLRKYESTPESDVQLIKPRRLAEMAIDSGLVNWIIGKVG